jgi:hypothetical protein
MVKIQFEILLFRGIVVLNPEFTDISPTDKTGSWLIRKLWQRKNPTFLAGA